MQREHDTTWRRGLWYSVAAFMFVRVVVLAVAYCAPQDRSRPGMWWSHVPLVRWDGGHYGAILMMGYPADDPRSERIAFFPAYPLVARVFTFWTSPDAALIITSHIASLVGVCFVYAWSCRRASPRAAFWCVLLISVLPPAMFLSASYSDGLLFCCVAVILWLLDRGRVYLAACVSALATATRPTGLAVAAIVVLWVWFYGAHPRWPRRALAGVLAGCVAVGGLVAYQAYLWHHYHRPDTFFLCQSNWGDPRPVRDPVKRILTLEPVVRPVLNTAKYIVRGQWSRLADPVRTWNPVLNFIILILAAKGLTRPDGIPRVVFVLPILVFLMAYLPDPYRGARMVGIARYQLVAVPCFLLAAKSVMRWPAPVKYALLAAMLGLECMYTAEFVNWGYVG